MEEKKSKKLAKGEITVYAIAASLALSVAITQAKTVRTGFPSARRLG